MDISGQYLTYDEYREFGGTLTEASFNLLEISARCQIDLRTQNRLVNETNIPTKVKLCVLHLIDKIDNYSKATENASGNIASENIDGYSVNYLTANQIQEIVKSKNAELQDIMTTDLYGVIVNKEHILYDGVK